MARSDDCLTECIGFISGPTIRSPLGSCFDEGKFTRTGSKWLGGVVVTELGDGGAYFAPPGDFSKVDFSACQKQEPEQYTYDLTMLHVYGKARIPATKIGELPRIDFEVEGDDNGKVQAVTRVWVNGKLQPLSSKADTKPKTAQHSKQAKPALPSLMTEAGERYQGLGWCDE